MKSPAFPPPAVLVKEMEEVFMGMTVVAVLATEWAISLDLVKSTIEFQIAKRTLEI